MKEQRIYDIENGYFVFTVFSSLRCKLNCKHCYLSEDQRRNSPILDLKDFENICEKVNDYFMKNVKSEEKNIYFYWYGGEPSEVGQDYLLEAKEIEEKVFDKSIKLENIILTNLMYDVESWIPFYKKFTNNYVQTSYDYLMRGSNYLKIWKENVKKLKKAGIRVSALNVVNQTMKNKELDVIKDYMELDLDEIGFLPFQKNTTNMAVQGKNYLENRGSMQSFSDFNIKLSKLTLNNVFNNEKIFNNGNISHIMKNYLEQSEDENINVINNIARQTLFLLPNGDFCLPDYYNDYFKNKEYTKLEVNALPKDYKQIKNFKPYVLDNGVEYLRIFDNGVSKSFEEILNSKERQSYLNKQKDRAGQKECQECKYKNICVMEFWKDSNLDNSGECPGGKQLIEFLINYYENLDEDKKQIFKEKFLNVHLT